MTPLAVLIGVALAVVVGHFFGQVGVIALGAILVAADLVIDLRSYRRPW